MQAVFALFFFLVLTEPAFSVFIPAGNEPGSILAWLLHLAAHRRCFAVKPAAYNEIFDFYMGLVKSVL